MLGNDIAKIVLSDPQVRAALRKHVPGIEKLESLDSLKDLKLDDAHFNVKGDGTILVYTATAATQELYQDPVKALKDAGVIPLDAKEPEQIDAATHYAGKPNESKYVELNNDVNGLEFYIDIRNPNHPG